MGDLASERGAAIELIIEEYRRLISHKPQHELLQYITKVNDNGFEHVGDKYHEFLDRFETPEDKKRDYVKVTKVLVSYYVALRNAVDEIEDIDMSQKSRSPVSITPIRTLDEIHDLPF